MSLATSLEPGPRATLFRLIGRLLLAEVDAELAASLAASPVFAARDPELGAALAGWDAARESAAAEAFAALFLLPGGACPVADFWLEAPAARGVHGEVRGAMAALGRAPDRAWGRLPEGHLGLLAELIALASEAGDEARARRLIAEAFEPWVGAFAAALEGKSPHPLYRVLGALIAGLAAPEDKEDI